MVINGYILPFILENKTCRQWLVIVQNLQIIEAFLTSELSQYRKGGGTFPSSELAETAADLKTPCVCDCLSYQPKLCFGVARRAWSLILQSKPSIVFWNSLREWLPDYAIIIGRD